MMSVIKWELWQRRWSIMWWSFGIAFFIIINLAFYPSFRDQADQLAAAFDNIPKSAMALLSDAGDFFSPVGYLSSQIFYLMLPMLIGILSISLGSSLLGREEKEGTIELLLSRPISRTRLLTGKALAGLIIVGIGGLVAALSTTILAKLVDLKVGSLEILLATLVTMLLALSFGAVAFLLTATGRARAASIGLATLFSLGGYIIASLQSAADWLKWPAKVFPFNYYKPAEILAGTYNWSNLLFVIGVIIGCGLLSIIIFRRRDITS